MAAKKTENTQVDFENILDEVAILRKGKNNDYGDGFIEVYDEYGMIGLEFDLGKKFKRIKQFRKSGSLSVADEKIEDTLKDLAIYALNGIIWWRKKNDKC